VAESGARGVDVVTRASVWNLDPAAYSPHSLHADGCAWVEKNCYIDVWIEVLHAHHLDPMAVMPFTLAVDFEGDQWTFFKPPQGDLAELYGVEVHELNVWRPLLAHAMHHVGEGKLVLTEADAYFLPDTAGTDYGRQHTKTTIAIETIDTDARLLGYFHNANYHTLGGADFANLFGIDAPPDPARLPLFAEIVRLDRVRHTSRSDLATRSVELLIHHLQRRPATNPVARFKARFEQELAAFASDGLAYHSYAFATLRQLGASFELTSLYLKWLDHAFGDTATVQAAEAFAEISSIAKALVLKGARVVVTKKAADFAPMLDRMQDSWQLGMDRLDSRFGARIGALG
jgi:hypothetical protein